MSFTVKYGNNVTAHARIKIFRVLDRYTENILFTIAF